MTESDARANSASLDALPPWLQKLAVESWQVELLISGFAIVGTAQLTALLEPIAAYVLFAFRTDIAEFLSSAHIYLTLGIVLLPVLFSVHFAVRAFWVGIVGLASVYPHGIGPERNSFAPEAYVEDVEERYPALPVWIDRTEVIASLIFVAAALVAMTFVGTAISLVALVLVAYLLESLTGGAVPFSVTTTTVLGVFSVVFVATQVLNTKRLRGKSWARRGYLAAQRSLQLAFSNVFAYPVAYLTTVLATNTRKAFVGWLIAGIIAVVALALVASQRTPLRAALNGLERHFARDLRTDIHLPARYASTWPSEDYTAISPYLREERVTPGALVEVSIPVLGEDRYRIDALTPEQSSAERDTTRRAARQLLRARKLNAHRSYFRYRVDTTVLEPADVVLYEKRGSGGGSEGGVRALVRLPPKLPTGRLDLWIDRALSDGVYEPRAVLPVIVE